MPFVASTDRDFGWEIRRSFSEISARFLGNLRRSGFVWSFQQRTPILARRRSRDVHLAVIVL